MPKWRGCWKFDNLTHKAHGKTGIEIVEASDEAVARTTLRYQVSRKLSGTTILQGYVRVTNIAEFGA